MRRLVLFDIDETILTTYGAGRRALEVAMSAVFGKKIVCEGVSLSGKTDPQICLEVLSSYGYSRDDVMPKLDKIFSAYLPELEREVTHAPEYRLHDGVVELLEVLHKDSTVTLGLITGNIEPGARIKLERGKLNGYFQFGAFGSDSANRMDLPAVAHARAKQALKQEVLQSDIVIIGDAVNDVLCAHGYGVRCIAVNTGKTPRAALQELNPGHLFESLADTQQVLAAIFAN